MVPRGSEAHLDYIERVGVTGTAQARRPGDGRFTEGGSEPGHADEHGAEAGVPLVRQRWEQGLATAAAKRHMAAAAAELSASRSDAARLRDHAGRVLRDPAAPAASDDATDPSAAAPPARPHGTAAAAAVAQRAARAASLLDDLLAER